MPISVSLEERDALCEVIEAQKGNLKDAAAPFAKQEWEKAEAAFRQHLQDCRLLACLRLEAPDKNGQVHIGMRIHELREALTRLTARRTAQLIIEESAGIPTSAQETFQGRAQLALRVAERCLKTLESRFETRYVVVDGETEESVTKPTLIRDFALDACEVFNESTTPAMNRTR